MYVWTRHKIPTWEGLGWLIFFSKVALKSVHSFPNTPQMFLQHFPKVSSAVLLRLPQNSSSNSVFFHFLRPLTSDCLCFQPRSSSDSQIPEASVQTGESLTAEADVQLSPVGSADQEVPFTEVHAQLAPAEQEEKEEEEKGEEREVNEEEEIEEGEQQEERGEEEASVVEADLSVLSEGVSQEYALSSTLQQEEEGEERGAEEEQS